MKKGYFIISFIFVVIISSVVIYLLVSAKNKVREVNDILLYQSNLEKKFTSYNYTIDNPKIILNPYEISPLTALIIFETKEKVSPTVVIKGKTNKTTYEYTFAENNIHYLPIYGLYSNTNNEVIIKYNDIEKTVFIKTEGLPTDFILPTKVTSKEDELNNDLYFYTPSSKGYTCAYDINGDVRWYLTDFFLWEINRLNNGNLMLSTNRLISTPYYMTGLVEIDLLGKIYYEYQVEGGYHHDYFELENGNIIVLSNNFENGTVEDYIVELDRKSGDIVKRIDLQDIILADTGKSENWTVYDWFHNNSVYYDKITNSLILSGRHQDIVLNIDYDTLKINYIIGDNTNFAEEYQQYFLKPIGDNFEWQYAQHAAKVLPNGDIFLFDNGINRSKIKEEYLEANDNYSRGVIYRVNKEDMTISQIYQYGKERGSSYYSPYISDVDYIDNNHYLIHSGGHSSKDNQVLNTPAGLGQADTLNSITTEILNNEIIFEIELPTNNYRCQKMSLYQTNNYKIVRGNRLGKIKKTATSTDKVLVFNYKDKDENYNSYNIILTKEFDRLVVNGTFKKNDKVYIILDKFMNKKVYELIVTKTPYTALCLDIFESIDTTEDINITKYINDIGLSGKYSIYIKINNTLYQTNEYVNF